MQSTGRHVLITGASSGIGAALACYYAKPRVQLALSGRDAQRLGVVAETCRNRGAIVSPLCADVRDSRRMREWIEAEDATTPLDLVIANAGIGGGPRESEAQMRNVLAVNLDGVLNTCWPAIDRMRGRGSGQIAITSSLAGYRGFADAPAYCASKAAVKTLGEAWRGALRRHGIRVSVICPGFVETPIVANNKSRMPFLMGAERAAQIIARGLAADRPRISFPLPMTLAAWFLAALPARASDWLLTPRGTTRRR